MYTHKITIQVPDEIVHRYSILEWEEHLLANGVVHPDERPLSYGRIAEVLAVEYWKYGAPYFNAHYEACTPEGLIKCTEDTTYTDRNGNKTNTKLLPTKPKPLVAADPSTMVMGVVSYAARAHYDH
jgi:hypothetical protein